jgi:hypothetical protein
MKIDNERSAEFSAVRLMGPAGRAAATLLPPSLDPPPSRFYTARVLKMYSVPHEDCACESSPRQSSEQQDSAAVNSQRRYREVRRERAYLN